LLHKTCSNRWDRARFRLASKAGTQTSRINHGTAIGVPDQV
jgi:hypothetical protein